LTRQISLAKIDKLYEFAAVASLESLLVIAGRKNALRIHTVKLKGLKFYILHKYTSNLNQG